MYKDQFSDINFLIKKNEFPNFQLLQYLIEELENNGTLLWPLNFRIDISSLMIKLLNKHIS